MKFITVEIAYDDDAIDIYDDKHQQGVVSGLMTGEGVVNARVVGVGESANDPGAKPQADDVATKHEGGEVVPAEES